MKALLPIILLLSLVAPAKANKVGSCGELAEFYLEFAKSKSIDDPASSWYKSGVFYGFVNGYRLGDNWRNFYVPGEVTHGQLGHVVGKYLQAHPEKWHLRRSQCVYDALYETWPNY